MFSQVRVHRIRCSCHAVSHLARSSQRAGEGVLGQRVLNGAFFDSQPSVHVRKLEPVLLLVFLVADAIVLAQLTQVGALQRNLLRQAIRSSCSQRALTSVSFSASATACSA
jgi:hypothetical protein